MKRSHKLLILALIVTGATNTIFLSLQDRQLIPQEKYPQNQQFFHPFIQLALMFVGQILCFIPYIILKLFKKKQNWLEVSGFMKTPCPLYLPFIPGLMDVLGSGLAYFALNLIASSVWQISRGGVIITTALFSRIFLHKKFDKNSVIGCVLTFAGITLVQLFQILLSDDNRPNNHSVVEQVIGVGLLLVSLVFNTIVLITQKMIFNKYTIHPLKMVFLEGIYGFIGILLIIIASGFFQCPEWGEIHKKCLVVEGRYYIESVSVFFQQISQNSTLIIFILFFLVSISVSVPIAVTISKVISPVSRTIADVCRTVLIWIFGIIVTVLFGENEEYNLENTGLILNICKAGGFIIVIIGTLTYHELIKWQKKDSQIQQSLLLSEDPERNIQNFIPTKNSSNFSRESLI